MVEVEYVQKVFAQFPCFFFTFWHDSYSDWYPKTLSASILLILLFFYPILSILYPGNNNSLVDIPKKVEVDYIRSFILFS